MIIIQIFRVDENHTVSARFLDNRRLSKQVLEMYQIIRVCLGEMKIINTNTRYISHPIVQLVYNRGYPYLLDAFELLKAFDQEHQRRGGFRALSFKQDLIDLEKIIYDNRHLFSKNWGFSYYLVIFIDVEISMFIETFNFMKYHTISIKGIN